VAKHGTARDDRRPGVGDLRTVRGKSEIRSAASSRADALDRLIHERLRLGIVSALAVNDSLSFSDLKKLMNTTDGNLSVHARKLEEAEYISCTKSFEGRMPKTQYKLTPAGRRALERYLDHMEALIRATRER
jgi:DNA-binding MarR family transcriptional regulator